MSVNWRDENSAARIKALAAANVSGSFDHTVPTWDIYYDLREALIWALLVTKFPSRSPWAITEDNWKDVYRRLYILERITGCRRVYNNGPREAREMYFNPAEIHSMIGLSVNAGNQSEVEFKKYIFGKLSNAAEVRLNDWETVHALTKAGEDNWDWERELMRIDMERRNK